MFFFLTKFLPWHCHPAEAAPPLAHSSPPMPRKSPAPLRPPSRRSPPPHCGHHPAVSCPSSSPLLPSPVADVPHPATAAVLPSAAPPLARFSPTPSWTSLARQRLPLRRRFKDFFFFTGWLDSASMGWTWPSLDQIWQEEGQV